MYESTEWGGNNKLILNEITQIINMLAFSFIELLYSPHRTQNVHCTYRRKIALSFFHALVLCLLTFIKRSCPRVLSLVSTAKRFPMYCTGNNTNRCRVVPFLP